MLTQETLGKISAVLNIEVSDLEAKIKSEQEETLEVPKLYNETQFSEVSTNRFEEGKKAATEILVKDLKAQHEVEVEGKDIGKFLDGFKSKVKAELDKTPNARIKELEADLEAVRASQQSALDEKEAAISDLSTKLRRQALNGEIITKLPDNLSIGKPDVLTIFHNEIQTKDEEGKTVFIRNGEVLKSETREPLKLEEVLPMFLDSHKFIQTGANGNGDAGGGGGTTNFTNMDEFMAHCEAEGIEPMGNDGQTLLAEAKKNPNFKL